LQFILLNYIIKYLFYLTHFTFFSHILIGIKIELCVERCIHLFSPLAVCRVPFTWCCQIFRWCSRVYVMFNWYSSYYLKYKCVISVCIISLYVWVGVYVGFPYCIFVLWLYVGLQVCVVCCFYFFFLSSCSLPWNTNFC
jgi:hypothetical protein